MLKDSGNLLFAGLGGQGIIFASEITAHSLIAGGFDVKKSEIHGMAQRGGPVLAHLRFGQNIYSPVIDLGTVDIQISFEYMESLRYLPYLRQGSQVIVNCLKIFPQNSNTETIRYPDDVTSSLEGLGLAVIEVDGLGISRSIHNPQAINMVLVGVLSCLLPVPEKYYFDTIKKYSPEKFQKSNIAAFQAGRQHELARFDNQ